MSDVLILPSRAEGVPRTIMEALSSGVPVVSSDLPQIRSAFGDSITYITENNLSETIRNINEIIGNRNNMTDGVLLDWNNTVFKTDKILSKIDNR